MANTQQKAENGSAKTLEANSQPPQISSITRPIDSDLGTADPTTTNTTTIAGGVVVEKWEGWPGDCVFRLIVPVLKVGSIIGRKGDIIKKICEETRSRVRVLEGPAGSPDRIVLISGQEEPDSPLSPAMNAALRVFKRVSGLPEDNSDAKAAGVAFCSIKLLVPSTQAISLIGKQGSVIKAIQESTSVAVRILSEEDTPLYAAADERIVDLQGEALTVLKGLEAVVGHLRKFLVDRSVLPLFEKIVYKTISQDQQVETWVDNPLLHSSSQSGIGTDYPLSSRVDSLLLERERLLESNLQPSGVSLYGQDHTLSAIRSLGLSRPGAPIVTQIAQTMQISFAYAEDIIGIGGANIAYIRRTSGATIAIKESRVPDEITVEIKGTSSQVQMAQQLILDFMSNHKESLSSSYAKLDTGYSSSYSQLGNIAYPSSSLSQQPYGSGFDSPGAGGGYSSYRL